VTTIFTRLILCEFPVAGARAPGRYRILGRFRRGSSLFGVDVGSARGGDRPGHEAQPKSPSPERALRVDIGSWVDSGEGRSLFGVDVGSARGGDGLGQVKAGPKWPGKIPYMPLYAIGYRDCHLS